MYVNVVRICIQCGTNVYLGGTKMGGTKKTLVQKTWLPNNVRGKEEDID